jgi:hypothetical protein
MAFLQADLTGLPHFNPIGVITRHRMRCLQCTVEGHRNAMAEADYTRDYH